WRDFVHLGVSYYDERSLERNNIGAEGATALANALVKNESLQTLDKLENLAAELSNARAKRSEEKAELHPMLRDFFAEQLSSENPSAIVADFDSQQAAVSEKEQALTTLQEAVKTDPEKIPERNQVRRDLVASIQETLAKSSQIELKERADYVTNTCRKLWQDILGEPANVDDAAELVTFGQVQEATQTMMEAIKAWVARHDTIASRERTTAALNVLEESTRRLGIQPTFFMTLTYPERSKELVLELQDVHQAFIAELNVLKKGDPMADAPLDKVRCALACMFSFHTRTILSVVSRIEDLGLLLSRLTVGLTEPNTEDVQRLFDVIQHKTRKRKRLVLDLEEARQDARRGTEEAKTRVIGLEEELTQIESVYKLDSELRRARARVLRHAEEHYPELLFDRTWLESIDVTDPATQKLSELGLLLTNAKRKDFQELADLAPNSGKSVLKVRDSDGRLFVLKSFHLAREEWSSRFYRQVTALAQLQSAYIVRIQGVFMQDAHHGCILMPFYEGGDLATWIVDNPHADLATRRRIAIGLLSGLYDLHLRGLVHCDVKPENVFLAKGLSPVLGDFDGVQKHDVTMTQPLQATIKYMAPELRNGNVDKVESAVDMFSVGVVLAELFEDAEISDATRSLILDLKSADPNQRPTALAALRHEAFQVEPVKVASCIICLDNWLVSEGVPCADGHFTCRECLSESVGAAAQPQAHVNVRRDGSMRCFSSDCDHFVPGRSIAAAVPDEDFEALLGIVRAHVERDAAAEQERQLRDRVDAALREHGLDPTTQNHIRTIQNEVLAMSCPRCSTVFADFDGCCALKCAACPCYFCAWCLQDTGDDSDACHQHVATCTSKPAGEEDPFFSDFAVVKQAWVRLRVQRLRKYLAGIQDAGVRADVQRILRPFLTPDIVDETLEYQYDAFLTHDWGENGANHEFVRLVNAKLQNADKVTWFDGERLRGDIVQQITRGIENSRKVVVFITERYMHKLETGGNDYCKDEFMTAVRIHTPARMIPVVLEAAMLDQSLWRGPLQFSLGGHLYIDFTTPAKRERYFSFLLVRISE
ncbi:Protein kinase, putative, partial [Hondaea fermentalgiana]